MTMPLQSWWHELNTWEPEIALAFYGRTLGWQFDSAPLPDGSAYWIAREEGRPVGGIFGLTAPNYSGIPSHWMTYMAVADIARAEQEGSKAVPRCTVIPWVGAVVGVCRRHLGVELEQARRIVALIIVVAKEAKFSAEFKVILAHYL